jgi:hypoxanthine-DNA glycosylase
VSGARVRSFDPIAGKNAQILVLGSMPGRKSLAARQYYAHQQNVFWRIIGELLELDSSSPYEGRVRALKAARIALWDVLHSCVRQGSLDTKIERETEVANDFRKFFRGHGKITHVFFNGAKAEASFKRHVARKIGAVPIIFARLPSTSPANASVPFDRKLEAWRAILRS